MQPTPLESTPEGEASPAIRSASLMQVEGAAHASETGALRFIDSRSGNAREAARDEWLLVTVGRVLPTARGRLAEVIDDAVERELHSRHAGPPGLGAARDADANLSDQLFRARQVGALRVLLTLPTLSPLASHDLALGADDSQALLFWARATRERPVELCVDASDRALSLHIDPIPLRLALDPSRDPASPLRVPSRPLARAVLSPPIAAPAPPLEAAPPIATAPPPAPAPAPVAATAPAASPPTASPAFADTWRTATLALTAARGPQPLATLERLFAASYLPLDTALHDPAETGDPRAVHARDEFRDTFSRVYLEAFQAFALTGKRPKMVLDAPEIAARIARQMSARTSQVLLVDSMRYDLGARVRDELVHLLAQKGTLTNELILWSALPTTTTHQLATLTQGVSALGANAEEEREETALRGRTAQTIRRVKIGSRDVYKLDLCDVRVREAGERVLPLLPSIATDVAGAIAKHAMSLAPRTLLLVFGDHGFTLGRDGAPSSGGSSPEEVLVPAFAFLMGEAH